MEQYGCSLLPGKAERSVNLAKQMIFPLDKTGKNTTSGMLDEEQLPQLVHIRPWPK